MIVALGNLISYAFVNASGIALRFRDPARISERTPQEMYAWYFYFLSFAFSAFFMYNWSLPVTYFLGALLLGVFIKLCLIP